MQSFKNGYNHLFFIRYACMAGYSLAIIPFYFAYKYATKNIVNQKPELQSNNFIHKRTNSLPSLINNNDSLRASLGPKYASLPENSVSKCDINENIPSPVSIEDNNQNNHEQIQKNLLINDPIIKIPPDSDEKHQELIPMCQFMYKMIRGIMFVGSCAFWSGYIWYLSLDNTFVAANNTIYQSQCVFVLLFSSIVLNTKVKFFHGMIH